LSASHSGCGECRRAHPSLATKAFAFFPSVFTIPKLSMSPDFSPSSANTPSMAATRGCQPLKFRRNEALGCQLPRAAWTVHAQRGSGTGAPQLSAEGARAFRFGGVVGEEHRPRLPVLITGHLAAATPPS
jgi:hypothetical protein